MKGLLALFEAAPDSGKQIEGFLDRLTALNRQNECKAWYTFHDTGDRYGVFMAADPEHVLAGPVHDAIMHESGKLLLPSPELHIVDILAHKLPVKQADDSRGVLLTFKAKGEYEHQAEEFLAQAKTYAMNESDTTSWFAFRLHNGEYGIFDTFPGKGARFRHLLGRIPRDLARHAFPLLENFPDLHMLEILEEQLESANTLTADSSSAPTS